MLRKCGAGPTLKYSVLFSKENMRCEQVRGEGRPSYLLYFDNCACLRTRLRTRNQSIRRCVFILWVGHIHSGTGHDCQEDPRTQRKMRRTETSYEERATPGLLTAWTPKPAEPPLGSWLPHTPPGLPRGGAREVDTHPRPAAAPIEGRWSPLKVREARGAMRERVLRGAGQ